MARRVTDVRQSQRGRVDLRRWTTVYVRWVASCRSQFEWAPFDPCKATTCVSVGMVRKNTPKALTLVQSRSKDSGHVLSAITIPWCSILQVTELVPFGDELS